MWEDTKEYGQIVRSVRRWQDTKERVHIRAIWVRGNGEHQEKEGNFYNALDWLLDNFETYWAADEAEMKIFVEDEVFYWKHPEITAPITIEEIEKQDEIIAENFKKSVTYINEHVFTFGVSDG